MSNNFVTADILCTIYLSFSQNIVNICICMRVDGRHSGVPFGNIKPQKKLTRRYTCQSNFVLPASCTASEKSTAKRLRQQMKLAS